MGGADFRYLYDLFIRQKIRKELGIPDDAYVYLSIGELSTRKNHEIVMRAMGELNMPQLWYLIAGEGNLRSYYQNFIIDNNLNIKLLGYRTDIKSLHKASDCFIQPSIREGLGMASLEAMADGLPLIASDLNGIRDYTKDGITGCCIDPYCKREVAEALMKMYNDFQFCTRCSYHNAKIARKFSAENSGQLMREIYKSENKNEE